MKHLERAWILLIFLATLSAGLTQGQDPEPQTLSFDLRRAFRYSADARTAIGLNLPIGQGRSLEAELDATRKGNGSLTLCGRSLRLWDCHDNGWVWEGECLHLQLVDLDGNGLRDLVVRGTLRNTETGRLRHVAGAYLLDAGGQGFRETCETPLRTRGLSYPDPMARAEGD